MRLSRTFVSGLLLGTLALASCSSSSDSAPQTAETTTSENSPAVTTAASSLLVRPVLQVAQLEDPAAVTSSVATAPGTAIFTDRNGYAYLVGEFDKQDGVFKPGASVVPKTVDGVASWSVVLGVHSDAAWSEITKACSALASSCPTGRTALIADGRVIFSPSATEVYGLSGSVELSGFSAEAEARTVADEISRA
jgi:hypothetical protein